MRPNIDISHTLNGRVKDYAEQQDVSLEEAYREIIEAGLEAVEDPDES
jgi:predicted DNA-binding protein